MYPSVRFTDQSLCHSRHCEPHRAAATSGRSRAGRDRLASDARRRGDTPGASSSDVLQSVQGPHLTRRGAALLCWVTGDRYTTVTSNSAGWSCSLLTLKWCSDDMCYFRRPFNLLQYFSREPREIFMVSIVIKFSQCSQCQRNAFCLWLLLRNTC